MNIKHLLSAAAASALLAGAAYAQDSTTGMTGEAPAVDQGQPADSVNPAADPSTAPADTTGAATSADPAAAPAAPADPAASADPAAQPMDSTASAASSAAAPAAAVQVANLTNGPIPDTAENRAKYGQPLSHAGKRSAAKGN